MRVQDVMDPRVSACRVDDTLQDAIRRLLDSGAAVLPVIDRSRSLVGTISERDVCISLYYEDARPAIVSVGDALNSRRVSCRPDESVEDALRTMRKFRVRSLPVTDGDGRVLGVVQEGDLEVAMRRDAGSLAANGGPPDGVTPGEAPGGGAGRIASTAEHAGIRPAPEDADPDEDW